MDTGFRYSVTESGILLIIDDYKARLQVIVKPTLEFFNIVIYEEQYLAYHVRFDIEYILDCVLAYFYCKSSYLTNQLSFL